jgi:drug/metabolite transporter (DMT)-like permease
VNPVVALFLGWLLIGESINLRTIIAAAVILTAVLLVITAPHPREHQAIEPVEA